MKKTVGLGIQDFEKVINRGSFYIDKTEFISKWWENEDDVTLITRPRRFGKTLMLSTVEKFFSIQQENGRELFEGLEVTRDDKVMTECGKWPVLFVSFANVKSNSYEKALVQFNQIFTDMASDLSFLKDSLDEKEREFYDAISDNMDEKMTEDCLHRYSRWLSSYYDKKIVLLIDEYDTPMQEAYVSGYWDHLSGFMRIMFNGALKTNPYMHKALLTGITRVSRESLFSDLNNLTVITTSSKGYADCFGFTEKEVFDSLEAHGYGEQKSKVKRWYDGFKFGDMDDIYNPWSILSFLKSGRYEPYWANTSSNSLVSKLVKEGDEKIKEAFETLLDGGIIEAEIDEQLVYGEMGKNEKAVWSLLFATGYLKEAGLKDRGGISLYRLRLTNYEVNVCFRIMVKRWFENAGSNYGYFVKGLLECDIDDMTDSLSEICESMMSSFDGSGRSAPENFYHGLVIGLLVELRESHEIKSNRESGLGRYDVMIRPKDKNENAIIIEFKSRRRSEKGKSLEELADKALRQIEDKKYEQELIDAGYSPERIKKLAFVFEGKEVFIKAAAEN